MNYFKRWYIQPVITKINDDVAIEIFNNRIAATAPSGYDFENIQFIQLFSTSEDGSTPSFTELAEDIAGEIYHCNVKFPLSDIKKIWSIEEITTSAYAEAIIENYGDFQTVLKSKIMENFVTHEEDKIKKVGRYLKNQLEGMRLSDRSVRDETLSVTISPNDGLALFTMIERTSDIFLSGRYYIETGEEEAGSIMSFQAIIFLQKQVVDEPRIEITDQFFAGPDNISLFGLNPLGLNKLRKVACYPVPKEERNPKDDDSGAETKRKKLTPEDIKKRELTKKQKADISKKVKAKLLQVSDSAFLNALLNADKIRTTRDAFDFVLNVFPLSQIIDLAIDCLKKYLPDAPDLVVCNVIMKNLSDAELQKILRYVNVNVTTDTVAAAFKAQLIDQFDGSVEDDSLGFKDFLLTQFNSNVGTKEIICAMVFAAIPAAITLLALYTKQSISNLTPEGTCGDPLLPTEKQAKKALENPVKDILNQIEKGLKSHPILGFTRNLPDTLLKQLILFVDQIIVKAIAFILQELAYLCDGSSKSDFANAPSQAQPFDSNINDLLINKNDDAVYDDLFNFINNISFNGAPDDVDIESIKDFFQDISDLLTLSELCVLMTGEPTDLRYNLIIDKLLYGLLSLGKYTPLKIVLDTRQKIKNFVNVFAENFDEAACNERIEDLTKRKKMLSDLCDSTDNAYIDDLKNKAAQDAIDDLLNQEKDLLEDLLNTIKDLTSPEAPEVFCGPDATARGVQPLLPSFQDASQLNIAKKHLASVLSIANKTFEVEINGFKTALTRSKQFDISKNSISAVSKIFSSGMAGNIGGALSKTYGIDPTTENEEPAFDKEGVEANVKYLSTQNKLVAPLVNEVFTSIGSENNLTVIPLETGLYGSTVLKISTSWQNSQLDYYLYLPSSSQLKPQGFNDEDYMIPVDELEGDDADRRLSPNGTKLVFSALDDNEVAVYNSSLSSQSSAYPLKKGKIFGTGGANNENQSSFSSEIQKTVQEDIGFFGDIIERIIIEHAEFISQSDLFKKQIFNNLQLTKKNTCSPALLSFDDIIEKTESRTKGIECQVGFGVLPTPSEIVHIASIYEAIMRVVVLNELLKSFFVFASFGLDTILPDFSDNATTADSFYYKYLSEVIGERMDELLPNEFKEVVERAVLLVGSSDLDIKIDDLQLSQVIKNNVFNSMKILQDAIRDRLKQSNIKTKIGGTGAEGELFEEYSEPNSTAIYQNMLQNILPVEPEFKILDPPSILSIDMDRKRITIPSGFYSDNPRLQNGGFFIERGLEIFNNKDQGKKSSLAPGEGGLVALSAQELNKLISLLPSREFLESAGVITPVVAGALQEAGIFDIEGQEEQAAAISQYKEFVATINYYLNKGSTEFETFSSYPVDKLQQSKAFYNMSNIVGKLSDTDDVKKTPSVFKSEPSLSSTSIQNTSYIWQKYLFGLEVDGTDAGNEGLSTLFNPISIGDREVNNDNNESLKKLIMLMARKQGRIPINSSEAEEIKQVFVAAQAFAEEVSKSLLFANPGAADGADNSAKKVIAELTALSPELDYDTLVQFLKGRLEKVDTYFYKLGRYETLNLLIKVDTTPATTSSLQTLFSKLESLDINLFPGDTILESAKNRQSFIQSVLERKYFLHENGGATYFKLPVAYRYQEVSTLEEYKTKIINDIPTGDAASGFADLTSFDLRESFLKPIFDSINYKDLLSFVSIMVTEILSKEYPTLDDIFKNTIITLGTGMKQATATSNRLNNPNLYENSFDVDAYAQPGFSNPDMISLFLEAIIKGVANMTDPTWRTPWFLPGPLTPFGILAKFLEGEDDQGMNPQKAAAKAAAETDSSSDGSGAYDCPDKE
tara:strand:- start:11533 stop:17046 length:5514 start_codon:yes stop_codon:yes gene_type:complete